MTRPMSFEEAWAFLVEPPLEETPELERFKTLALAFYKAGELQAVANCDRIVSSALASRDAGKPTP